MATRKTDDEDDFMAVAWASFVDWASRNTDMWAAFEAATGRRLARPASTPLDRMIDQATGHDPKPRTEDVEAFVLWVTEYHWGLESAPRAYREKVEKQRAGSESKP